MNASHVSVSCLPSLYQTFSRWKFDKVLTKIILHSFLDTVYCTSIRRRPGHADTMFNEQYGDVPFRRVTSHPQRSVPPATFQ